MGGSSVLSQRSQLSLTLRRCLPRGTLTPVGIPVSFCHICGLGPSVLDTTRCLPLSGFTRASNVKYAGTNKCTYCYPRTCVYVENAAKTFTRLTCQFRLFTRVWPDKYCSVVSIGVIYQLPLLLRSTAGKLASNWMWLGRRVMSGRF